MQDTIMTTIKHRSPGRGNEVVISLESPSQMSLDSSIKDYFDRYHPNGYMTHIISRYSVPNGERAIISRLASCD